MVGRLGYAFGRAMVYTKGGLAFFDGEAAIAGAEGLPDPLALLITPTKTFTGWTIGLGLEYALSSTWSLKTEYQHFDFGKEHSEIKSAQLLDGSFRDTFDFSHTLLFDSVRFGLNYHFGGHNQ